MKDPMTDTTNSAVASDPPAAAAGEALDDRRELALIAFERTRMPMVVTDPRRPDDPIVLANQAFLDLTGYSADEVIGRNCRLLQGPQTSANDVQELRAGLAAGGDVSVEILNYRKNGTAFWNELAISPVIGDDGELLYFFGSQKDVTERRRLQALEATERLLLMEVDHRAMNALALVQSIVRLSSPHDAPGYVAAVNGRVDAIARAHRLLARNQWSEVEFKDVLALDAERHGKRIDADGPPMPIDPELVQPIALVVHEMLSNAVAHGALSRPQGKLSIRWYTENDDAVLSWREQGVTLASFDRRPRVGLTITEGVIKRQLGGTVSFSWPSTGLEAQLTFSRATAATNSRL
jgi:PAS domain S-box-containing protein